MVDGPQFRIPSAIARHLLVFSRLQSPSAFLESATTKTNQSDEWGTNLGAIPSHVLRNISDTVRGFKPMILNAKK